jgi:hypothetical protein
MACRHLSCQGCDLRAAGKRLRNFLTPNWKSQVNLRHENYPKEGKMKLLRITALIVLTACCGLTGAAKATPAAGLVTAAPAVRTLATQAPVASVEKAWWYRRHYWHRHYWHRHYWHRRYWHPYWHRRYYWHRYYW